MRPATPGFVVTLAAVILLTVVVFSVPYFKSVFLFKASFKHGGVNGSITCGTLGFCLDLSNGTLLCSRPSVGYVLDISDLQVPQVVVKWITSALVLHVAALIAAAVSALFGLLAHLRELSTTTCSTIISGTAAVIAVFAFIFDLVLFFVAKARISSVGSAQIGSAVWLNFAACVLLFFSGCLYSCGRCCLNKRNKPYEGRDRYTKGKDSPERGLPEFPEIPKEVDERDERTGTILGDQVLFSNPGGYVPVKSDNQGYLPAEPGTRAIDGQDQNIPNRPQRQPSDSSHGSTRYGSYPYATPSPYMMSDFSPADRQIYSHPSPMPFANRPIAQDFSATGQRLNQYNPRDPYEESLLYHPQQFMPPSIPHSLPPSGTYFPLRPFAPNSNPNQPAPATDPGQRLNYSQYSIRPPSPSLPMPSVFNPSDQHIAVAANPYVIRSPSPQYPIRSPSPSLPMLSAFNPSDQHIAVAANPYVIRSPSPQQNQPIEAQRPQPPSTPYPPPPLLQPGHRGGVEATLPPLPPKPHGINEHGNIPGGETSDDSPPGYTS